MSRKMHYRHVTRDKLGLSIKVPCGMWGMHLTRDTTKDASLVTCVRCLQWITKNDQHHPTQTP